MQQGRQRRVVIGVLAALFVAAFVYFLSSGPKPRAGTCVDADGALVGCSDPAARDKLVREVDSGRECPASSSKLYTFRSGTYCGVALRGAPAPRPDYVPCLLSAGAKLAQGPADLAFARGFEAPRPSASGQATGTIKVRGDDWRIFYVLHEGQLDPGLATVVARPSAVVFVAYITDAPAHRAEVAAATRCARD